jgi:hypothetical protein
MLENLLLFHHLNILFSFRLTGNVIRDTMLENLLLFHHVNILSSFRLTSDVIRDTILEPRLLDAVIEVVVHVTISLNNQLI